MLSLSRMVRGGEGGTGASVLVGDGAVGDIAVGGMRRGVYAGGDGTERRISVARRSAAGRVGVRARRKDRSHVEQVLDETPPAVLDLTDAGGERRREARNIPPSTHRLPTRDTESWAPA